MATISRKQRGSAVIEFTMAGIPLMFLMFSTLELSIGVWNYFTIDHAANVAVRYAAVHGATCAASGNTCTVTVGQIATVLQNAATGVPPANVNVTLTTNSGATTSCTPLTNCTSNGTTWPPSSNNDNAVGKNITISATYNFATALGMFWFRDGTVKFGPVRFDAISTQQILY
jgi:Flp pilus assembly protein TadG